MPVRPVHVPMLQFLGQGYPHIGDGEAEAQCLAGPGVVAVEQYLVTLAPYQATTESQDLPFDIGADGMPIFRYSERAPATRMSLEELQRAVPPSKAFCA